MERLDHSFENHFILTGSALHRLPAVLSDEQEKKSGYEELPGCTADHFIGSGGRNWRVYFSAGAEYED